MNRNYIKQGFWSFYYKLIFRLQIFYVNNIYCYFSKTVRNQLKNFKNIPIIIINYNQLKNLQLLVDYLLKSGYYNIHIIDNNSNYSPLISYYKSINQRINIHFNKSNSGHMVLWKKKSLFKIFHKGYYVVTDPDILPIKDCPRDFLSHLLELSRNSNSKYKVGFSLKIDDIPIEYDRREKVLKWEKKYWEREDINGNYIADIDTTFALYRPLIKTRKFFYTGLRTKFPYQARHFGWYINSNSLSEEEEFYKKTANISSSWNYDKNLFIK